MNFNYKKTCQDLLADLPERTKKVIECRFGLKDQKTETLESIGKNYGITRERVRQIEKEGLLKLKPKMKNYQNVSQYFFDQLKHYGNLKKEDALLFLFGGNDFQNHVYFMLNLEDGFNRFSENQDLYSLWTIDFKSLNLAQKIIDSFLNKLTKTGRPLSLEDFKSSQRNLTPKALLSYFEVSKKISQNPEGLFGLKDWPEIHPRGIKDKAYLVLKREREPLHFTKVAELINSLPLYYSQKMNKSRALPQTVHNELIRDPRFVLVGRGTYALSEWGFVPGTVLDIIKKTLKESKKPLTKEQILEKVLKQRMVKENTVFLNLNNREYFLKDLKGKYKIKES